MSYDDHKTETFLTRLDMRLSRYAVNRVKLDERPAYVIARQAVLHHTVLSKLTRGIDKIIREDDPRVIRLAKVLRVPVSEMLEQD